MRRLHSFCVGATATVLILVFSSVSTDANPINLDAIHGDYRDGDILLLRGDSLLGRASILLGGATNKFGHVVLIEATDDGEVFAYHSIPRRNRRNRSGVVAERLHDLLTRQRIIEIVKLRPDSNEISLVSLVEGAKRKVEMEIPFDYRFDRSSRNELYCTEFIEAVFEEAGYELFPAIAADQYLFPDDFLMARGLNQISSLQDPPTSKTGAFYEHS